MKKILLLAALLFGINATAQMEIKERETVEELWSNSLRGQSIKILTIDEDTSFLFLYQNAKYRYLISTESISFSGENELLSFLEACSQVIEESKEFEISIDGDNLLLNRKGKRVSVITSRGWLFLGAQSINKIKEALAAD